MIRCCFSGLMFLGMVEANASLVLAARMITLHAAGLFLLTSMSGPDAATLANCLVLRDIGVSPLEYELHSPL